MLLGCRQRAFRSVSVVFALLHSRDWPTSQATHQWSSWCTAEDQRGATNCSATVREVRNQEARKVVRATRAKTTQDGTESIHGCCGETLYCLTDAIKITSRLVCSLGVHFVQQMYEDKHQACSSRMLTLIMNIDALIEQKSFQSWCISWKKKTKKCANLYN